VEKKPTPETKAMKGFKCPFADIVKRVEGDLRSFSVDL